MSTLAIFIIYFCFCLMYKNRQLSYIFVLKSLQTLKINKYRVEIGLRIKKSEKRLKWYLVWPLIDLYEWYENWKTNRDRNSKSKV